MDETELDKLESVTKFSGFRRDQSCEVILKLIKEIRILNSRMIKLEQEIDDLITRPNK